MSQIVNLKEYDDRLSRSMQDKLYFLDHIPYADVFLDYGCGDGALLEEIRDWEPLTYLFGFDESKEQIAAAYARNIDECNFTTDEYSAIQDCIYLQEKGNKTAIIFSSVLHEIYSSMSLLRMDEFWEEIFGAGFDYICIRDMGMRLEELYSFANSEESFLTHANANPAQIRDFIKVLNVERAANTMTLNKKGHLYEFLLKYHYKDNWNRELHERYLINIDDILSKVEVGGKYQITHFKRYILPYLKTKVQEDLGVLMTENTHFQLILEKK